MTPVHLTPADLPALTARLTGHSGPAAVDDLDRWSSADLEALRFGLSTCDLRRPAVIDGAPGTLDGLVDRIVAELGRIGEHRAVRAHRPELWTEAERARIEAAMDVDDDDVWFYIDGEAEVMDGGLLFDVYEPYIWPDM